MKTIRFAIAFVLLSAALILHGCSTENRGSGGSTNTIIVPRAVYSDQ